MKLHIFLFDIHISCGSSDISLLEFEFNCHVVFNYDVDQGQ